MTAKTLLKRMTVGTFVRFLNLFCTGCKRTPVVIIDGETGRELDLLYVRYSISSQGENYIAVDARPSGTKWSKS